MNESFVKLHFQLVLRPTMKISGIIWLLLIESSAEKNQASYAWDSKPERYGRSSLDDDVHLLLKQGLKIGYLPPNRYNGKLNI